MKKQTALSKWVWKTIAIVLCMAMMLSCDSNESPTAVIKITGVIAGSIVTVPVQIEFDGSASSDPDGTISLYEWDFGDGTMTSGQFAEHLYTSPGKITIHLTVTDSEGASHTAELILNGNSRPVAHVVVDGGVTSGVIPFTVNLNGSTSTDQDGSIVSYLWELDGTTATTPVISHTFATEGTYKVRLSVADNAGAIGKDSVLIEATKPTVYMNAQLFSKWTYEVTSYLKRNGQGSPTTGTFTSTVVTNRFNDQLQLSNAGTLTYPGGSIPSTFFILDDGLQLSARGSGTSSLSLVLDRSALNKSFSNYTYIFADKNIYPAKTTKSSQTVPAGTFSTYMTEASGNNYSEQYVTYRLEINSRQHISDEVGMVELYYSRYTVDLTCSTCPALSLLIHVKLKSYHIRLADGTLLEGGN